MSTRLVYILLNDSNDSLQNVYQKLLAAQARLYGIDITVILVRRTTVSTSLCKSYWVARSTRCVVQCDRDSEQHSSGIQVPTLTRMLSLLVLMVVIAIRTRVSTLFPLLFDSSNICPGIITEFHKSGALMMHSVQTLVDQMIADAGPKHVPIFLDSCGSAAYSLVTAGYTREFHGHENAPVLADSISAVIEFALKVSIGNVLV